VCCEHIQGKPKDSFSVVMIHCRKVHGQPEMISINQVQETEQELGRNQACFDGIGGEAENGNDK
jgi:hypothetical protein